VNGPPGRRSAPSSATEGTPEVIDTTTSSASLAGRTVSRRRPHRPDERGGWKKPRGEREAPHPSFVDVDRHRVVCRECPWYWTRLGASFLELREMGKRHRANMREARE
jgi:hypothetical protein